MCVYVYVCVYVFECVCVFEFILSLDIDDQEEGRIILH